MDTMPIHPLMPFWLNHLSNFYKIWSRILYGSCPADMTSEKTAQQKAYSKQKDK